MLNNKKFRFLGVTLISAVLLLNSLFTWGALYQIGERQLSFEDSVVTYLSMLNTPTEDLPLGLDIHVTMKHYRDGILVGYSHHPGTLTTLGKNWIEDQLGDSPGADPAKWIGLSNSTDSPSAAWTAIPAEITTGNMTRAAGTYASTGDGTWNITNSFSPSETNSTRLVGLYYAAAGNFLLASDTINVVNYENGDTVEIQWSLSAS